MAVDVDPPTLRAVMAHVPSGVAVVTADTPAGPAGLTVGSFVSASLDPPLLGFLVQHTSTSWPLIAPRPSFCVNVLGEDATDLCAAFARSGSAGGDKFAGVSWTPGPHGAPLLDGVVAWFECTPHAVQDAGDHLFVLGRVAHLGRGPTDRPLVFCHGRLQRLAG